MVLSYHINDSSYVVLNVIIVLKQMASVLYLLGQQ